MEFAGALSAHAAEPTEVHLQQVEVQADRALKHVLMNDQLFATLNQWVDKHYRDEISEADLADPQLLQESRSALDELTQILNLGSVYPFQQG